MLFGRESTSNRMARFTTINIVIVDTGKSLNLNLRPLLACHLGENYAQSGILRLLLKCVSKFVHRNKEIEDANSRVAFNYASLKLT